MIRTIVFLATILFAFSCSDRAEKKKEKIVEEFKKVSSRLDKTNKKMSHERAIFMMNMLLQRKMSVDSFDRVKATEEKANRFISYLDSIKQDYKIANVRFLYDRLQSVISVLNEHATSDTLKSMIGTVEEMSTTRFHSSDEFINKVFKDASMEAAITIINSFDFHIKRIELQILGTYLNKYTLHNKPIQR